LGAINHWNQRFPGIMVPRSSQGDFVTFRFAAGVCQSAVGRQGGQQSIEIHDNCAQGSIVHEVGHALGLLHEHQRPDRNSFVNILWSNIESGKGHNFEIPGSGSSRGLGSYDYGSIMHYGTTSFGINGATTIEVLQPLPPGVIVGQRTALSPGDEAGIRQRYCALMTLSPNPISNLSALGGSYAFHITTPPYCTWFASENISWITLTGATTGMGNGTVTFSLSRNLGRLRSYVINVVNGIAWGNVYISQKGENNRL
jgi:hypothetical protein